MKEREELLMRAVELYYQQNLSQNEVAKIIEVSRPMVSRLLIEARNTGIVEIKIHNKIKKNGDLSYQLRNAFNLKDAIVVAGNYNYEEATKKCGIVAAEFLHSILENNMTIGITWGSMINALCDSLKPREYYNVRVLQMVGCLGSGHPDIDGIEIAHRISKKINGTYSNIVAPAYVDNPHIQEYLLTQPQIAATIKNASNADIILTGIGSIFNSRSTLEVSGFLKESSRKDLIKKGCVGHLAARFFDKDGTEMYMENHFPIAIPLSILSKAKWSIGICAGTSRAKSAIAAIKSGYINTLIADEAIANEMLEISNT